MNDASERRARILEHLARMDGGCDRIVAWVFEHGTLAQFPRVTEYMAKENGGIGWEDSYQNYLIARLCASKWFEKDGKAGDLFHCTIDGTSWFRERDEWRMMAYKDRLLCRSPQDSRAGLTQLGAMPEEHPVFFSEDFFRTVGFDPASAQRIDLGFLVRYLTELADGSCETLPSDEDRGLETRDPGSGAVART
jgi:hypothetical protein